MAVEKLLKKHSKNRLNIFENSKILVQNIVYVPLVSFS